MKRIAKLGLMTAGFFVFFAVVRAEALPIHPDVRKLLSQPQPAPVQFAPARAGWYGSEMPKPSDTVNVTYEQLRPATTAKLVHRSLIAAFVPDYRAVAAIALVILLLRRIRKNRQKALATALPGAVTTIPPPAPPEKPRDIERAA